MNPQTLNPAALEIAPAADKRILVWDWPVRIGHWLMVASFALAWLTAESEAWRLVHVGAGYAFGAVVAFRVLWGFVGTRHARFDAFVRGPRAAWDYLRSLTTAQPMHTVGHNPAGAFAIIALLIFGVIAVGSGWAAYNDIGGEFAEELHEGLTGAMLAVVLVHVAGVILGSLKHRENLVAAMFSGRKAGEARAAIESPKLLAGVVLLAWVAASVAWML